MRFLPFNDSKHDSVNFDHGRWIKHDQFTNMTNFVKNDTCNDTYCNPTFQPKTYYSSTQTIVLPKLGIIVIYSFPIGSRLRCQLGIFKVRAEKLRATHLK